MQTSGAGTAILQCRPREQAWAVQIGPCAAKDGRSRNCSSAGSPMLPQARHGRNQNELLIGMHMDSCMLATKTGIPNTSEIIHEAMKQIRRDDPRMLKPAFVRNQFSDALESVFNVTYERYKGYEKDAIDSLAESLLSGWSSSISRREALGMFRTAVTEAIKMEKSLSQSRSSRAGTSFEIIVQELLSIIGIPSERVTRGDKKAGLNRIDLVIPDRKTAVTSPDRAHFLSLKTSLRERWREVVEEQTQGQRTHLLTILQNEVLTDRVAQNIVEHGIFLYVPDRIKNDRFADEPRIRKLSDLPASIT